MTTMRQPQAEQATHELQRKLSNEPVNNFV